MLFYSNMQTANSFTPLTPTEAIERYSRELTFTDPSDGNRVVIRPALIGTLFFERGSQPDVRKGMLDCVDRFRAMFGERLEGGKNGETKYSRRRPRGRRYAFSGIAIAVARGGGHLDLGRGVTVLLSHKS
ncbi:hypothetical protein [Cupriavidus sp. BIC8F]|uniref:hypothetical protein n=1 Tax=Cupriavidus sp. BIC8F TaxID=3079014 RepID=UPI002916CB4D|nr:hypothetical protein [Cupriavidus sp. BIC8F]